ncbi:MAG: AAA family ATPase [Chitinivibrionales bacterium]|nr:AAA family ATPase [Chitinivibrionales bacterium]
MYKLAHGGFVADNPFVYGVTVDGTHFINREKEIQTITSALAGGQNIILYSPRRYGKTSLIKKVGEELKKRNILYFYVDFYKLSSVEELYTFYSNAIINELQSPIDKMWNIIKNMIPTVNPRIVYQEPGLPSVEISAPLSLLTKTQTLSELFDAVEKHAMRSKKKACVVFDEFQEVAVIENGEIIKKCMRSSFQHHKKVSYAFLGSKNHLIKSIFGDTNSPFYHFGKHIDLDVIRDESWAKYISSGFSKTGVPAADDEIEAVIKITGGHPYYTQMLASEIWEVRKGKKRAEKADIDTALHSIINVKKDVFIEIWEGLNGKDRRLLKSIAGHESAAVYSTAFIELHHLGSAASIRRNIQKLVARDILGRTMLHEYYVLDPLFKRWIVLAGLEN